MSAVIFDLDDTLYAEFDYVSSGFMVASEFIGLTYSCDKWLVFERMMQILRQAGRGRVFDTVLQEIGVYSRDTVMLLLYLYRTHRPSIHLYEDAISVLSWLRRHEIRIGILTDGVACVQRNKIAALDLESYVDAILCTDDLGREYWKPSPVPFRIMLGLLQTHASKSLYIGDNPAKDFFGANSVGMRTVHVKRGTHADLASGAPGDRGAAHFIVRGLDELRGISALSISLSDQEFSSGSAS